MVGAKRFFTNPRRLDTPSSLDVPLPIIDFNTPDMMEPAEPTRELSESDEEAVEGGEDMEVALRSGSAPQNLVASFSGGDVWILLLFCLMNFITLTLTWHSSLLLFIEHTTDSVLRELRTLHQMVARLENTCTNTVHNGNTTASAPHSSGTNSPEHRPVLVSYPSSQL